MRRIDAGYIINRILRMRLLGKRRKKPKRKFMDVMSEVKMVWTCARKCLIYRGQGADDGATRIEEDQGGSLWM